jgi:hypothetical protein
MEGGVNVRKVILAIAVWFIPRLGHAAGLRELIVGASPDAQLYVYGVIAMFAAGLVGKAGGMILSACGEGRTGRLVANGSYLAAVGIFLSLALMLFKQFVNMVAG